MMNPQSHRGYLPQQSLTSKFMSSFGQQHSQQVDQNMNHVQNGASNLGTHQHNLSSGFGNGNYPSPQHTAAATANIQNTSPHWQEQHNLLNASRSASEPHHHARQAAILNKNSTANVTVAGGVNPNSYNPPVSQNRKDGPPADVAELKNNNGEVERQDWKALDLGGQGLHALSNALFSYTFLDKLYINHNKLTKLPPAIGKLKLLQLLDASNNQLTELPPELGMLTNLKQLLVFDNKLTVLPYELGSLHKLEVIGVEGNPLQEAYKSILIKEGTRSLIVNLRDHAPDPPIPMDRDWVVLDDSRINNPKADADIFQVVSYNILCDKYATATQYGYVATWALEWPYRRDRISDQLTNAKADIICLQEVDLDSFEDFFVPALKVDNFAGIHQPKSRAKTMSEQERRKVDGCATFYNTTKYSMLDKYVLDFSSSAIAREDFKRTADIFNRVMPKDNIAIIAFLENRQTGSRLIVANAHITWDPQYKDVKLVQVAMLMEEIHRLAAGWQKFPASQDLDPNVTPPPPYTDHTQIPLIICGDFNSSADSGVYELLARGTIGSDHDDLSGRVYGNLTRDGISHPFPLKSAYSNMGELKFTNYTPGFTGTIDYIWYTTNSMNVTGLLGDVDEKYLATVPGFPNVHFPSDHILLQAEFQVKPRKEIVKKPPPPDFGGGPSRNR
ncbi:Endonuclease/exonuclease/phosphatase [Sphaerosporella brunnea]|uniref:CCR4-Not complex 3'-5'-exoribonuclease subunit Ccr4 n=1 Tax=Sphaerosporella brunnea TaxID=1250544 RepID=A0A5J5F0D3_9PEZI|nr:Endonuclease/exonuclease/phosphatase [Sphaerosporella brunnea]